MAVCPIRPRPQSRQHNAQNQLTSVEGNTLAYDANGNMKTDESGQALVYDAWNRLVSVTPSGGSATTYAYDALCRRIQQTPAGGTMRSFFYSDQWQVIEEREGGVVKATNAWSPALYVDALVYRDRDTDGSGSLDERIYPLHDANFNVTALTNASGTVVERFIYGPYGSVTVDANWASRGGRLGRSLASSLGRIGLGQMRSVTWRALGPPQHDSGSTIPPSSFRSPAATLAA